ncbi:mannose-6-phosphate isomerase, class I [Actinomycetospora straminea]|uniref:mannose-6-phosphate isomerase n=1 Tax=Actinomycetospora straminea TaxID=663607 RepID=A0ABP9F0U9_9PSEU|nr:mannose-6-phosphate isomerase, class I [Actinomycetospora straminea]MDD7935543.1 mannose-6-phosphate isomerase, class I [Actinomycetospora straminea]
MEVLRGSVRTYAWGSRTHLAELLGEEVPSPHPQAELWLGAHRDEPSRLVTGHAPGNDGADTRSLADVLREDPAGTLGPTRRERWSDRLPYLLKVLAAEEPLSLQAHPSAEQAAAGYAREEAAGVPRTAAERNYPDPLPKPELLCALTEFHALAGFRDPAETVALLRALDVRALDHHTELLAAQPDADGLRALFTTWITLPQRAVDDIVPALLDGCVAHARARGAFTTEARTLLDLGERYPGDAGVLAALLLNRLALAPGQCLYQPAGSPHAYLAGAGVELMANSDNVLRCGLTPKHVDVPELLRVLDFAPGPPTLLPGEGRGPVTRFTPSEYFSLARCAFTGDEADLPDDGVALGVEGPRIVVTVEGRVRLRTSRGQDREVPRGTAAWLPACDGPVTVAPVDGPALAFVAADGLGG